MTAALAEAYRATLYSAGSVQIRIGERSPSADRAMARHRARAAAFVTACNPEGRMMVRSRNLTLHRRLQARLRGARLAFIEGEGRGLDGRWPAEPSLLVFGLHRRAAAALGRSCHQNAVVTIRRGKRADLLSLR